ncbi:hypothetical protein PHYPSEUDO_014916 [Phytophthora pseudosyringae]|uniref:Myb-like DNA-binding protein n=1 Tax=Phytophthora pseudosyringae TaxID=221518 RepID=A0A8T1V705_9STRA|nr:hypothetical protein PHYPSEUDO_014916 [Phytophthora pseudosyringae]
MSVQGCSAQATKANSSFPSSMAHYMHRRSAWGEGKLIRIKPTVAKAGTTVYSSKQSQPLKMWTQEEHEKFLEAMEKYPAGPWKVIAAFIGTKTTRQIMTHAQKYR